MYKMNCEYFEEGIIIEEGTYNIIVIENPGVLGKILYSLHNEEDYFKIYDELYKNVPSKSIMYIHDILSFNFEDRKVKTSLYNYFASIMNQDQSIKETIEESYENMIKRIIMFLNENCDLEISWKEKIDVIEILKFVGITIDEYQITNVFEKTQMVLNLLNEIMRGNIIFFVNLSTMTTNEEYSFILEQIELNNQTVVLIESTENNLEKKSHYCLDYDFYLTKI
ncbi:MAG: type II-A CRISPR-associated protein Csn2 [Anaerovoracaceae bacterium]